jgi:phosphopantothenoylcysteine decarboxylase/phosphopantothenate--cysteine ligase
VTYVDVETAAELGAAVKKAFESADVLLMAAAVADFRPAAPVDAKIKKSGKAGLEVQMEATEDVLAAVSAMRRPHQLIVGFAAEHGEQAMEHARAKLERKALDAVVVNDISVEGIGFDSPDNEVAIVTADQTLAVPRAAKTEIATRIVDEVERLRAAQPAGRA